MHAFLARGLTPGEPGPAPDEDPLVLGWRLDDAPATIDDGRITDAKTMLTLMLARSRGLI